MIKIRIILIYDVGEDRVGKILKICREYLSHIQNSVFEGDITEANYRELKSRIKNVINQDFDSVIIFNLWNNNYKKEVIGIEKNPQDNIL